MIRAIALSVVLSCLVASASAQPAPAPPTQVAPAAKPAAKKPAPPKAAVTSKPVAPIASGPCLGVISAVGDSFDLQKVGMTIFGNENIEAPISSWGFDDLVVAKIRSAVGPRYAVRRIPHPPGAFLPKEDLNLTLFRDSEAEFTTLIKQIAAPAKCDRYVVVTKGASQFNGLKVFVKGIGIVNYGFGPVERNYVFALAYVRVYDGQSFAVLKKGMAVIDEEPLLVQAMWLKPIRGPHKQLDKSLWPGSPEEAAKSALMRDTARALLNAGLEKSLPGLLAQ